MCSAAEADELRGALQAARAETESARVAAAKAEADMEDLAGAFQGLESHAVQLEAELRDARSQAPAQSAQPAGA
jgi:predicted  nucleic acid-binding Zn-ribbon protein